MENILVLLRAFLVMTHQDGLLIVNVGIDEGHRLRVKDFGFPFTDYFVWVDFLGFHLSFFHNIFLKGLDILVFLNLLSNLFQDLGMILSHCAVRLHDGSEAIACHFTNSIQLISKGFDKFIDLLSGVR